MANASNNIIIIAYSNGCVRLRVFTPSSNLNELYPPTKTPAAQRAVDLANEFKQLNQIRSGSYNVTVMQEWKAHRRSLRFLPLDL